MTLRLGDTLIAGAGANKDLSNLTSQGKNTANWSTNVTNCITEIPQDIKLELNNGTLTLKAGSKVYVPNGFESDGTTPKFDVVTVSEDVSWISSTTSGTRLGLYTGGSIVGIISQYIYSGNTSTMNSTTAYTYARFYNTETNRIYIGDSNGGNWVEAKNNSLPVCIFENNSSGLVTSIDQIFNGFGYIGSTVFALPGVKGLIPNGRNEDGSLKNIEIATNSVVTRTFSDTTTAPNVIEISSYINISVISSLLRLYDEAENHIMNTSDNSIRLTFPIASCTRTSGVISDWNPKTAFHALDYNDSSTISGWSMPSSRYIDLTLGASGATYIAPANGYISLVTSGIVAGNMGYFCQVYDNGVEIRRFGEQSSSGAYQVYTLNFEIKKGQIFSLSYYGTTPSFFRFIYAEGENV